MKEGERKDMFTLVGKTDSVKTGESDNGPWVRFLGQFEAVCMFNIDPEVIGTHFVSGTAYLPEPYESMTFAALREADGGSVEIAVTISIEAQEASAVGYIFKVKSLRPVQLSDNLSDLRALMPAIDTPKLGADKPTKK